jgi:hypothetical protein
MNSTQTKSKTNNTNTITQQQQQQSLNWIRGPLMLTCAAMYGEFEAQNEQSIDVPLIVIKQLQPNLDCSLKRKQ